MRVFLVFRQPLFHPPPQTCDIAGFLHKNFMALPWGCWAGTPRFERKAKTVKKN